MVGEASAHVQGESLKAAASLSDVAFSTPRSPGGENEMRYFTIIAAALIGLNVSALAQSLNDWQSLPEDPSMREVCANTLRYSTAITNQRNQGATLATLLRWAEQEAERSAADLPSEPLMPIGTMLIVTKLIQQSYLAAPIYQQIKGGFPQFAYRSCLKGKPIG
jgi:hypothetical protein